MSITDLPAILDIRREKLKVLAGDLATQYETLINQAGVVMTAAVAARTLMLASGQSQDPTVGALFEAAMDQLDRAIGGLAQVSRNALGLQNQLQAGVKDAVIKT